MEKNRSALESNLRIKLVAAIVSVDPSSKKKRGEITRNWFLDDELDQTYHRPNLLRALDGDIKR